MQFRCIKDIHIVVQSPPSISRSFHHPQQKLCPHGSNPSSSPFQLLASSASCILNSVLGISVSRAIWYLSFCSAWCFWESSTLWWILAVHSFLSMSNNSTSLIHFLLLAVICAHNTGKNKAGRFYPQTCRLYIVLPWVNSAKPAFSIC